MFTTENPAIAQQQQLTFQKTISSRFKNYLLNGDFGVPAQRPSIVNGYYLPRWIVSPGSGTQPGGPLRIEFSQVQSNAGGNPADGFVSGDQSTFLYFQQSTAGSTTAPRVVQLVEGVRTLAGQKATVSFWVWSTGTGQLRVGLRQHFGTGGTPSANVNTADLTFNFLGNAIWQKLEGTFDVPSIAGKTIGTSKTDHLGLRIVLPTNFTGQFGLTNVQLEAGSVATDFEKRSPALEWALCQRYYQDAYLTCQSPASNGQTVRTMCPLNYPMRATPTLTAANEFASGYPNTPNVLLGGLSGGRYFVYEDRTANTTGVVSYSTRVFCDAELLEA